MILDTIAQHKLFEVEERKRLKPIDDIGSMTLSKTRHFARAITGVRGELPKVITEVKKASPSKGIIRKDFDPVVIAKSYESAGSSALSILTDEKFFQGHIDYLTGCRNATSLPALRKDFIIDEYQIFEARLAGADAILLIAALLDTNKLAKFRVLAEELEMAALVEVHDERELDSAMESGSKIIGINNRNLQTFEVDLKTTFNLRPRISDDHIVVSESGISTNEQLRMLADVGVDAVLVGESLMRADDPREKLKELIQP